MYNIKGALYSIINSEPSDSTDSKIAYIIYQNLHAFEHISAKELAIICNVSTSAITRFCKKLGLEGFYDLYYLIKTFQRDPQGRPDEKFSITNHCSKSISLMDYVNLQEKEVNHLKKNLDIDKIFKLARYLYDYDRIYLMGVSQSLSSALNLQASLSFNGIFSRVISVPLKQKEILSSLSDDTLVIIFSASGNFLKNTFERTSIKKHKNSKLVLITQNSDYQKNPLYDLVISSNSNLDYSSDHTPFTILCSLISLACYQISN